MTDTAKSMNLEQLVLDFNVDLHKLGVAHDHLGEWLRVLGYDPDEVGDGISDIVTSTGKEIIRRGENRAMTLDQLADLIGPCMVQSFFIGFYVGRRLAEEERRGSGDAAPE